MKPVVRKLNPDQRREYRRSHGFFLRKELVMVGDYYRLTKYADKMKELKR